MKQCTLSKSIQLTGIGIHKNKINSIVLEPAEENEGLSLINNKNIIKQISPYIVQSALHQISLGTNSKSQIYTTEHLLSTLYSIGINNCKITVKQGNEIPIIDGSAYPFAKLILENGIIKQNSSVNIKNIPFPICLKLNNKYLIALPPEKDNILRINAHISFPQYKIKEDYSLILSKDNFLNKIAKARTFGFIEHWHKLKEKGYGLGASYKNCIVFSTEQALNPPLRYNNECVRHKILDFIASLALVNYRLIGQFYLYKSGHLIDSLFIKILDQIISKNYIDRKYKENIITDSNKIQKIINKDFCGSPH